MAEEILAGVARRRRILVATDFSEGARLALERALELAPALGAEVILIHAVDVAAFAELPVDVEAIISARRKEARAQLAALADALDPGRRIIARADTTDGPPARAIVDSAAAEGADLIIVGSHGRTGLRRLILGSVAERVARLAARDVLVVHGGKESRK